MDILKELDRQKECGIVGNFKEGSKIADQLLTYIDTERPKRMQQREDALKNLKESEILLANMFRAEYNRGWYVMMDGDLLGGFELLNGPGRAVECWGKPYINSPQPMWTGQDLTNKYILFYSEAGVGDEIAFIRFTKELSNLGAKVIVACSMELIPLLSRIPYISGIVARESVDRVYHDYWVQSMESTVPLKIQYEDLDGSPYIKPHSDYVYKFMRIIDSKKLKVGIRWLGQEGDVYENRVFPPELLFDIVDNPNIQAYSLQRDTAKRLDGKHIDKLPEHIIDLEPYLDTWDDTAGAIENMDLIISSCTSVPHLSAAMGKQTWVIPPIMFYFIWAYPGNKTPWYDSITLFRQEKYGQWIEPFNKIKQELKKII
jgi:hypothetical protein